MDADNVGRAAATTCMSLGAGILVPRHHDQLSKMYITAAGAAGHHRAKYRTADVVEDHSENHAAKDACCDVSTVGVCRRTSLEDYYLAGCGMAILHLEGVAAGRLALSVAPARVKRAPA